MSIIYKGKLYDSRRALFREFNIDNTAVTWHESKGLSLEQAVDKAILGKQKSAAVIYKGHEYSSLPILCIEFDISYPALWRRLKSDEPLEQAVDDVVKFKFGTISDPLGNKFKNVTKMCEYYNISYSCYNQRKIAGWTERECLGIDEHVSVKVISGNKVTDPFGKEFAAVTLLCEAYNINPSRYRHRLDSGWTQREALGIDEHEGNNVKESREVTGPDGTKYKNMVELCEVYGVSASNYRNRLSFGWTQEEALELVPMSRVKLNERKSLHSVTDHLGKKFYCTRAMCRAHGVNEGTFISRRKLGLPLEECIRPTEEKQVFTDPFGIEYTLLKDMCAAYGINPPTYTNRLRAGKTQEQALEIDTVGLSPYEVLGPNGVRYPNRKVLCKTYGVSEWAYAKRLLRGYSLEEALELIDDADVLDKDIIEANREIAVRRCIHTDDVNYVYEVYLMDRGSIAFMTAAQIRMYPVGWKTIVE